MRTFLADHPFAHVSFDESNCVATLPVQLLAAFPFDLWPYAVWALIAIVLVAIVLFGIFFGSLWLQAYASNANISMGSLIGMSLRQVNPAMIVKAKIIGRQASLDISSDESMTSARLEAHQLAGGDILKVVRAMVEAHRADLSLDFDQACAIDLAGRDILSAVRSNVFPKVIDCPDPAAGAGRMISGVARDGVELLVRVRVTVRTNLNQLVGGATEETIIARVGQGIISSIGDAETYSDVLAAPDVISKGLLASGLESNTSFYIVSIDIADIDVGKNIGARLRSEQAGADMRTAQAKAEVRSANAVARRQEMRVKTTENRAALKLAEAEIPSAMACAILQGQMSVMQDAIQKPITRISIYQDGTKRKGA